MSYSNAYFALSAKNRTKIGKSPLVKWILEKCPEDPRPDIDHLYKEIQHPEVMSVLIEDMEIGGISQEDFLSALNHVFGKSKNQPQKKGLVYKLPAQYKPPSKSDISKLFENFWDPVEPIQFNGQDVSNSLNWTQATVGGFEWANLATHGYQEIQKYVMKYVRSGGTVEGLVNVQMKALEDTQLDEETDFSPYFDRIKKRLPVREVIMVSGEEWSLKDSFTTNFDKVNFNEQARSGLPEPVTQLMTLAMQTKHKPMAETIYQEFRKRDVMELLDFLSSSLAWVIATRMANKFAIYEIAKLYQKTRMYHVYSAPIRILGMTFYQNLKDRIAPWDPEEESKDSESMLGFSWYHGGAKWFYEYIANREEGKMTMLYYSDDSLIFIRKGNLVKMCSPDFSHMDGSMRYPHVELNKRFDRMRCYLHGGTEQDAKVYDFLNQISVYHPVVASGKEVYLKSYGLSSGAANTTGFNQTQTALCSCIAEDVFNEGGYSFDTFEEFVLDWKEKVKDLAGFIVKEGTEKVATYRLSLEQEGEVLPISFLGQDLGVCKIRDGDSVIVSFPPEEKLCLSYVFPPPLSEGETKYDSRSARAIGLALTGGFYYEKSYNMLKSDFEQCLLQNSKDQNATPITIDSLIKTTRIYGELFHRFEEGHEIAILKTHNWSRSFAPREWFIALFEKDFKYDVIAQPILKSNKVPVSIKEMTRLIGLGSRPTSKLRAGVPQKAAAYKKIEQKNDSFLESFNKKLLANKEKSVKEKKKEQDVKVTPTPVKQKPPNKKVVTTVPSRNMNIFLNEMLRAGNFSRTDLIEKLKVRPEENSAFSAALKEGVKSGKFARKDDDFKSTGGTFDITVKGKQLPAVKEEKEVAEVKQLQPFVSKDPDTDLSDFLLAVGQGYSSNRLLQNRYKAKWVELKESAKRQQLIVVDKDGNVKLIEE